MCLQYYVVHWSSMHAVDVVDKSSIMHTVDGVEQGSMHAVDVVDYNSIVHKVDVVDYMQ